MKTLLGAIILAGVVAGGCSAPEPGTPTPNLVKVVTPVGAKPASDIAVLCAASYFDKASQYPKGAPGTEAYWDASSFWLQQVEKVEPDKARAQGQVAGMHQLLQGLKDPAVYFDDQIKDCERRREKLANG